MSGLLSAIWDTFTSYFPEQQPKGYFDEKPKGESSFRTEKRVYDLKTNQANLEEGFAGEYPLAYEDEVAKGSIGYFRKKIIELTIEVPHVAELLDYTETPQAENILVIAEKKFKTLKDDYLKGPGNGKTKGVDEQTLLEFKQDFDYIADILKKERTRLDGRKDLTMGDPLPGLTENRTRKSGDGSKHNTILDRDGNEREIYLSQGWNAEAERFEWWDEAEWKNLKRREGTTVGKGNVTKMTEVKGGVHAYGKLTKEEAEKLLEKERGVTEKLRKEMTVNFNKRMNPKDENFNENVKTGVINNCNMSEKLAGLFKLTKEDLGGMDPAELYMEKEVDPPVMVKKLIKNDKGEVVEVEEKKKIAGILSRAVGGVIGQGGFDKKTVTPEMVFEKISKAADNIKHGKGTDEDANMITQFMSAFVDGLTEVIEDLHAKQQFDKLWPKFAQAFELVDEKGEPDEGAKHNLLSRVSGYKSLAGGVSDTQSGKGTRKDFTRIGLTPDKEWQNFDDGSLIKGDISGSMHSQLLAQELSESFELVGKEGSQKPKGIRGANADMQIKDKAVLNARVLDALLMTAGGKINLSDKEGNITGQKDLVFHTAYEMINGMQAITGCPPIKQAEATDVMELLGKGKSFTDAMDDVVGKQLPMPWRPKVN